MILVLSPQEGLRKRFEEALRAQHIAVAHAPDLASWTEQNSLGLPHLAILDISHTSDAGAALMEELDQTEDLSMLWVLMVSVPCTINHRIQSLRNGALDCLAADVDTEELVLKAQRLLGLCPRSKYAPPAEMTERERIVAMIQKRLRQNINVESLARALHTSRSSLQRACIRYFKIGPKELITQHKIQQAMRLIDLGSNNVASLAFTVGYSNVNNFISAFKRQTNQTPKEYMKTKHLLEEAS
ncbi:MAG: helix-turn-helix domain-containing protein [Bacteroidota bacterium]